MNSIDRQKILGQGEFGIVCLGEVSTMVKSRSYENLNRKSRISVAVKMCRSISNAALKGILSELKILSFLGKHSNIVSLVGAYTDLVREGKYNSYFIIN